MTSRIKEHDRAAAIVIGLDTSPGLQTARILAERGVPVIGLAEHPSHPYTRTRACQEVIFTPTSGEALIETLVSLGPQLEHRAVLYPSHDLCVLHVSQHRQILERWYHIMLPDADTVEMLLDKDRFYRYAEQESLPIPPTYWLYTRADAERTAAELHFPCILKPAVKTTAWQQHVGQKVFKVGSADELLRIYDLAAVYVDAMVVQQWVEGGDGDLYTCNCYFDGSSTAVAAVVARKLRQWPPTTGVGCLREECNNEVVLTETLKLLERAAFRGLAYAEFKYDRQADKYYLIEVNVGRPTGGSAIAEATGVALHYAMYCDAVDWPLPTELQQQHNGAKWVHISADVRSALHAYRQGELTLANWWRSLRGPRVYASFSWSDPIPFWAQLISPVLRRLTPRGVKPTTQAPVRTPESAG